MDVELVEKEPDHTFQVETEPAQISREHVQRRIVMECNLPGRDLGGLIGGSGGGAENRSYDIDLLKRGINPRCRVSCDQEQVCQNPLRHGWNYGPVRIGECIAIAFRAELPSAGGRRSLLSSASIVISVSEVE